MVRGFRSFPCVSWLDHPTRPPTIADLWFAPRSPSDPYKLITKRIVALAGDVVHTKPPFPDPTVRVPDGHVWVEGDNGRSSLDSNTYGPVSARLIEGRLTHILYPFYKFGRVKWWEWEEPEESKRARRL